MTSTTHGDKRTAYRSSFHQPPAIRGARTWTQQIIDALRDLWEQTCRMLKRCTSTASGPRGCDLKSTNHIHPSQYVGTNGPPVEALHTNHQCFAELQPAPNRGKPWIRILNLEPGAFGDPLHGILTVEELDATEPFDALSYYCGPPVLDCSITVNGAPGFRITQNLRNALQRVRKKDGGRRIWVDAVCIDQEDEREKSSQIRHMHAVYSRAVEVCIYWGECAEQRPHRSEDDHIYIHVGGDLQDKDHDMGLIWGDKGVCWASQTPLRTAQVPQESSNGLIKAPVEKQLSPRGLEGCTPDTWDINPDVFTEALEKELRDNALETDSWWHYWWSRLWTVQELVLAKHPVVYCGPYVMMWEAVTRLWTLKCQTIRGGTDGLMSVRRICESREAINYLNVLRDQSRRTIHNLLLATVDKCFTEPKDRVFALLGALPQGTVSLDYALDTRVIYTFTAVHCMITQGTFDIIFSRWERSYQLGPDTDRLRSFVPDFDRPHHSFIHKDPHATCHGSEPCLTSLERGRWEGGRWGAERASNAPSLLDEVDNKCRERAGSILVLSGRDINIDVIENTVSRCRIAFSGAYITTISKLYRLGQHNIDWILADLSRSPSRYFSESLCEGNTHWDVSTSYQEEQHAYDIYTLLLESCSLHGKCESSDAEVSTDLRFEAQRQREIIRNTRKTVHEPKECLDFLAIADECLRRPWKVCLTGPLASCRCDWTANRNFPNRMGEVHGVLQILLDAVALEETWSGTFFISSDGHLGIGPESTQPGDQIVVLDGARSPFVLRALESSSDHALIGDSFVLGLMHGEVKDLYARGKLQSTKIVIQ